MPDLSPSLFSVATGSLAPSPPWNYRMLTDPAAAAAFRGLGLKATRINAITALGDIFGPNLTNNPNWSHFDHLVAGFNSALPGVKLIMVLTNHGQYNVADANVRNRLAGCYVQVAKYLKSKNIRVDYWEVLNEPNFDTPANVVADTEVAVRNALRAAGDNTPVGGPTTSWSEPAWMQASANAGAQFTSWHTYVKGPGDSVPTATLFDRALTVGGGAAANSPHPRVLTELNIDTWNKPGVTPDPRQQQIEGAVFIALANISAASKGMHSTYVWRLENDDGSYGVFHTHTWNVNPVGALIQAANKYLVPGTLGPFPNLGGRVTGLVSDGGASGKSMLVVNYNTGGPPSTVQVPAGMTLRWTQDPANQHGKAASDAPASISLPALGIAIMSSTSGTVTPPTTPTTPVENDPDGTKVGVGVPLHANDHTWLIKTDGKVYVDDQVDASTASVVSLQAVAPYVVQTNAAGGSWSKVNPADPWATYVPPVTPPVEPPVVPPIQDVAVKAANWDALVAALRPLWRAITGS